MRYYDYRTKNHLTGKIVRGVITADDIDSAEAILKRRGENIISISEMQDFLGIRRMLHNISGRAGKKTKLELFTMLRFMMESGMSLHEALVSIRDTSENKALKMLSDRMSNEVRRGATLSSAAQSTGQFDVSVTEQIKAGEEAGNIIDTLDRMINQTERELDFKSKIKSAMMYPIIICVVMVVVLWVMMTVVVPSLAETLVSMGGDLPLITKVVIVISNAMAKSTPYIIILTLLLVLVFRTAIKNTDFKLWWDTLKLKLPIIGTILQKIELSRFCRNLAAMQKSGITLVSSLRIVEEAIKNSCIAKSVSKACKLVEVSGINLASALAQSGKFPSTLIQLIEIGVSSGKISDVLDKISDQYEREVNTSLKRVTSLIEPVMIVVVGVIAGAVVISIFLPMFEMTSNMGV